MRPSLGTRVAGAVLVALLASDPAVAQVTSGTKDAGEASAKEKKKSKKHAEFVKAMETIAASTNKHRLVAAMQKLRKGYPDSHDALVEALKGRSSRARAYAVQILGEFGDPKEVFKHVSYGLNDPVASVRLAAVTAMLRMGEGAREALERYLPREEEKNVRKMAIKMLHRLGDKKAIPFLVERLEVEKDAGARRFTVKALQALSGQKIGDDLNAWRRYTLKESEERQRRELEKYAERLLEKKKKAEAKQ